MLQKIRRSATLAAFMGCAVCVLAETPARRSPAWLKSGVIYEVNPRAFSATGDFRGIRERLPYLRDLGVTILWLMPIHPAGKERSKGSLGSPYAVRDYYGINPDYGTAEDLRNLVTEAHRMGFKIVIDIVANHTSWDSVLMKQPSYYRHGPSGEIVSPVPDWTDVAALDYTNPQLRGYMIAMLEYWIREFDLDGFRCDVAGMVPVSFWNEARAALDRIKPNIMMLAEWHAPELVAKAFDLDYSWPLHSKLTEVIENGAGAFGLQAELASERASYPAGALHLRFSDNHDEKRAIARFGERGALAASAFMFTLDGVPLVYNGMEVGDTTESGAPALFEKLPVFWQIVERRPEFPKFYRQMIALRRTHAALQQGETHWQENSDPRRLVSYVREGSGERYLILINCSNQPLEGSVYGLAAEAWTDRTPDARPAGAGPTPEFTLPAVRLEPWGFRIFQATARSAGR